MIHLDYRDARPIYNQIFDGIREQILAGILQPGDKLPSVRELAGELAINPNTIQRAYRELEADGWIGSMAGKGSFVCGAPTADQEREKLLAQFDTLSAQLMAKGVSAAELQKRLGRDTHA